MCQSSNQEQKPSHSEVVAESLTQGLHHLGLTVNNVEAVSDFFIRHLNFKKVGEKPAYPAIFVSDGVTLLTLWQAKDPQTAAPFNRHTQIGLHHFALKVRSSDALNALHLTLCMLTDVVIEFGPEPLGNGPVRHMMCLIGGLRVEFIAVPGLA